MNLSSALRLPPAAQIAFTGSGGKTTTLFQLAHTLPGIVWVTTTTHLGVQQAQLADQHYIIDAPEELNSPLLLSKKVCLVTGLMTIDYRLHAPEERVLESMHILTKEKNLYLLVEADGARLLPLKAPAEHEPSIPEWCNVVLVFVGLSGEGKPLTAEWVHRPERYAELSGLAMGETITTQAMVTCLLHPHGGMKGIPPGARKIAVLNQADTPVLQAAAQQMAPGLLAGGYDGVFVGSLKYHPEDGMWFSK